MKNWVRSLGAVVGGFLVTGLSSTAADAVMHAIGIFPSSGADMPAPLFALAAAYRAAFTVGGGYTTAWLAPNRPMRHVWILAAIGFLASLAGLAVYFSHSAGTLGPAWYAFSIPAEAIPCVWLGGWLACRNSAAVPSHR